MQQARKHWFSNKWLRRTLEVVLIVAVLFGVRLYTQRGTVEGPAPPLEGARLDGTPVSLEHYAGRPILVHFWATWCPVCTFENDSIEALSRDYQVLTVAMQSGDALEIREFMAERELGFPVVVDEHGELAQRYGVRGVPASFVIGPQGMIRFKEVGYTTGPGLRLRMWLAGRG